MEIYIIQHFIICSKIHLMIGFDSDIAQSVLTEKLIRPKYSSEEKCIFKLMNNLLVKGFSDQSVELLGRISPIVPPPSMLTVKTSFRTFRGRGAPRASRCRYLAASTAPRWPAPRCSRRAAHPCIPCVPTSTTLS